MPIDQFTREQFEAALPRHKITGAQLWVHAGFHGEHVYRIQVGGNVHIQVWSSLDQSGIASACGKNSIRCYLTDLAGAPLSNKLQAYVTRMPGWQSRLREQLTKLWRMGARIVKPCRCGRQLHVYLCKRGAHIGRTFLTCNKYPKDYPKDSDNDCGYYAWLPESAKAPKLKPSQDPDIA